MTVYFKGHLSWYKCKKVSYLLSNLLREECFELNREINRQDIMQFKVTDVYDYLVMIKKEKGFENQFYMFYIIT